MVKAECIGGPLDGETREEFDHVRWFPVAEDEAWWIGAHVVGHELPPPPDRAAHYRLVNGRWAYMPPR